MIKQLHTNIWWEGAAKILLRKGLPGWLWSTLDSENGQIDFKKFQTEKMPNCGK